MLRLLVILCACIAAHAEPRTGGVKRPALHHPMTARSLTREPQSPRSQHVAAASPDGKSPSFYWAVMHNWLYFLSLGFNAINMAYLTRQIANGNLEASPASIALSGNIEAVDRILTFLGVSFLAALSDVHGRRPLMAWASVGFGLTNLIQAKASGPKALYLADLIDGCSSCMTPVCQAFVADCSPPSRRAANLGIFQGLSIGMAFIIAFPVGGILGAKFGPRLPLLIAASLQLLNALLIVTVTPEPLPKARRAGRTLDLAQANPFGALWRLFGRPNLLRHVCTVYALVTLSRNALDAQFVNYASIRFGWSQQQTGPVMVLVGLMLAVAPRVLVPRIGLRNAVTYGIGILAFGLSATGLAPTPAGFVLGLFVVSVGCVCIPALQALLTNLAPPGERGALLGALGSLTELQSAVGSTLYAAVLAAFTSDAAPIKGLPGMHFFVASAMLLIAWGVASRAFRTFEAEATRAADAPADAAALGDMM